MIHGVVQNGEILPLDPVPDDWDGQHVVIEPDESAGRDEPAAIERWRAELEAVGPAQYEPGEREMVAQVLSDADREAREAVKRSWARFDDALPPGHQSPQRRD